MSRRRDLVDALANVPLFADCSKRDLAIISRHTEVVAVPAGSELCRQGADGDAFYVLLDGTAAVRRGSRTVARLGPGDHFGELALLDPAPRDATVVTDSAVTVGVLGARPFRAVVRDLPALNEKLLRALVRRVREADAQLGRRRSGPVRAAGR